MYFRDDSDVSVFLRDDPNKSSGYLPRFQGLGPIRRPVTAQGSLLGRGKEVVLLMIGNVGT